MGVWESEWECVAWECVGWLGCVGRTLQALVHMLAECSAVLVPCRVQTAATRAHMVGSVLQFCPNCR